MKKFLPVVFSGLAALSFSTLTLAGDDYKNKNSSQGAGVDSGRTGAESGVSGAGPTENPNVTRDAQGREHVNKGKHTGQMKNKKDTDSSAGSGSTSAPKSESPSISGSASGGASGSANTEAK